MPCSIAWRLSEWLHVWLTGEVVNRLQSGGCGGRGRCSSARSRVTGIFLRPIPSVASFVSAAIDDRHDRAKLSAAVSGRRASGLYRFSVGRRRQVRRRRRRRHSKRPRRRQLVTGQLPPPPAHSQAEWSHDRRRVKSVSPAGRCVRAVFCLQWPIGGGGGCGEYFRAAADKTLPY